MESVVDIVRMQILSNASNKSKNQWQYLILLAVLGNYKRLWEQFVAILTQLSPFFKRFLEGRPALKKIEAPPEEKPKTVIKLRFSNGELDNKILKEIINRHAIEFDTIQLKNPHTWHVIQPKTIRLDEDIYFALNFTEKPPPPQPVKTDKTKKDDNDKDDKDHSSSSLQPPVEVELCDTRGQIYSYQRSLKEVLDFIHEKYVPVASKPVVVKKATPVTKRILLYNMFVGRATKFNEKNELCGEVLEFTVSKSLETLFLENNVKDLLFSQIDKFNDPNWYAERGLPRTLGILLYGEPGCGKTSFIKTMCSHMKRRVLIVDFKLVKTVTHLRNIFSGNFNEDKENGDVVRFTKDNTIYVFEDFDCMSEVFMDRKVKEKDDQKQEQENEKDKEFQREMIKLRALEKIELLKQGRSKKKSKKERRAALVNKTAVASTDDTIKPAVGAIDSDDSDDISALAKLNATDETWTPGATDYGFEDHYGSLYGGKYDWKKWGGWRGPQRITLADFLELLDGIIEMDGRIIIMTTNQREKMDSALVRPGRIDLDLELCAPSRQLIAEIFAHMYRHENLDLLKEVFESHFDDIPHRLVSTARVINCFMYSKPEQGIKALIQSGEQKQLGESENAIDIRKLFLEEPHHDVTFDQMWENVKKKYARENVDVSADTKEAIDIWSVLKDAPDIVIAVSTCGTAGGKSSSILDINGKDVFETYFASDKKQYFYINFRDYRVRPTKYGIRKHPTSAYALLNWNLEASNNDSDEEDWEILCTHRDDRSVVENDYVVFDVACPTYYKYLRIHSIGPSWYYDGTTRRAHFSLEAFQIIGYIIRTT